MEFVYYLPVLRPIRYPGERAFVPHLSVPLGVILALVSVGVLIYFIHHISRSILQEQAEMIVRRARTEVPEGEDRTAVEERYREAIEAIQAP